MKAQQGCSHSIHTCTQTVMPSFIQEKKTHTVHRCRGDLTYGPTLQGIDRERKRGGEGGVKRKGVR